ncbi:hypothetical protein L195_g051454, partial [Trifolium pratense]
GFSIKIGAITCFLGDSCCNDVDFAIIASEEHKQLKNFETEFVLSVVSQKSQNQSSVQMFSSPIKVKRHHVGNVRFLQDHDQHNKKELDNHSEPNNHSTPDNPSEPAITLQTLINHQNLITLQNLDMQWKVFYLGLLPNVMSFFFYLIVL